MKYITLSFVFILATFFVSCSSKEYSKKHRTMEQKQSEQKAFNDLKEELKKK